MSSIQKRPDGRYRVRWRDPEGKERAKHFARKIDAERFRVTVEADVLRGAYIDVTLGRQSFRSYAEGWRASQPHRANTAARVASQLPKHVYPRIGGRLLAAVRPSEVQSLVAACRSRCRQGRCAPSWQRSARCSRQPPRTGRSGSTRALV
jgi:hypothetical protein